MQSDFVLCVQVESLIDVVFAAVRPVRAVHPVSWPRTANLIRQVIKGSNEQAVGVGIFSFQSEGFTARVRRPMQYAS